MFEAINKRLKQAMSGVPTVAQWKQTRGCRFDP